MREVSRLTGVSGAGVAAGPAGRPGGALTTAL